MCACLYRWAVGMAVRRRPLHESDGMRISRAYIVEEEQQQDEAAEGK